MQNIYAFKRRLRNNIDWEVESRGLGLVAGVDRSIKGDHIFFHVPGLRLNEDKLKHKRPRVLKQTHSIHHTKHIISI